MKTRITTLLLLLALSTVTFAQLNKATLESKFPLLNLPYEISVESILVPEPNGKADFTKYLALKDVVTAMVYDAMKDATKTIRPALQKKTILSSTAQINAIGRIVIGNQNFIVYNLNDRKANAYINVMYVASLDNNYNIVDIANLSFYSISVKEDKSYNFTRIIRSASLSGGRLLLKETGRRISNVDAAGKESLDTQVSTRASLFKTDGTVEPIMVLSK